MTQNKIDLLRALTDPLYKIQLIKEANPQLETGELHPKNMNFMGPGTKFRDRISLNYKGNVGTENYFLPSTIEDYFSFFHDLPYFIPDDYIKYKADIEFLNNQEKYGKWNKNKLLAMGGISTRALERTIKNINTLLSEKERIKKDKEWDEVNNKLKEIKKAYNKYLDQTGVFILDDPINGTYNKFVVKSGWTQNDGQEGKLKQKYYKEFYNKVEDFFNKFLPEKYNESKYKIQPLNLDNIKKVSFIPTLGKETKGTLKPSNYPYWKKELPSVDVILNRKPKYEEQNKDEIKKIISKSKLRDVIKEPSHIDKNIDVEEDDDEQEIPEEEIKAILEGRQIKPFETPVEIDDDDLLIFPM